MIDREIHGAAISPSVSLIHGRSSFETSAPNFSFRAVHACRAVSWSTPSRETRSAKKARHCPLELRAAIAAYRHTATESPAYSVHECTAGNSTTCTVYAAKTHFKFNIQCV